MKALDKLDIVNFLLKQTARDPAFAHKVEYLSRCLQIYGIHIGDGVDLSMRDRIIVEEYTKEVTEIVIDLLDERIKSE